MRIKIFRKIRDLILPWNKIKIKTLSRSWTDRDEVLVHAMMQILTDFVEREMLSRMTWQERCSWYDKAIADSIEDWDKESTQAQYEEDKKIYEIYQWWHTRGKSYDPYVDLKDCSCNKIDGFFNECSFCRDKIRAMFKLDDEFEQEKTQKCIDLLNLRLRLWS